MWDFLEKVFTRSYVEEHTYRDKTLVETKTYNVVDGMFRIADAIHELATAIRDHNPRSHQD